MKIQLSTSSISVLNEIASRGGFYNLQCEHPRAYSNTSNLDYYFAATLKTAEGLELKLEGKFGADPNELISEAWNKFGPILDTPAGKRFNLQPALEASPTQPKDLPS